MNGSVLRRQVGIAGMSIGVLFNYAVLCGGTLMKGIITVRREQNVSSITWTCSISISSTVKPKQKKNTLCTCYGKEVESRQPRGNMCHGGT